MIGRDLYNELKSKGCKYGGIYFMHEPIFMPIDTTLIKGILSTDFDCFSDRGVDFIEKKDPVMAHLFSLPTEPWKALRNKLTPTFTSGKIKTMFDSIVLRGKELAEVCGENIDKPININDLSVRYAVDVIGCCAFGIDCNSLRNPEEKFQKIAKRVSIPPIWNGIKFFFSLMGPKLIKYGNLSVMDEEVKKFFLGVIEQNVHYRETNNIRRNDFFQLLLDMKKKDETMSDMNNSIKMDVKRMAAQSFVFFAAGFETSSMTINLCLFELSQHFEIQERLRLEIRNVLKEHDGKITYDGIKSMSYLECVIQETLRKYPPLGFLNRVCTKTYKIPDTNVTIEKGTKVFISLFGLQRDPEYFTDAENFNPDRFIDKNKESITPYTNMPFGEGHRICLGERFGKIQLKIAIISLILNYEFTLNPMTQLPLEFQAHSFIWTFKNPVLFNAKKVNV